MALRRNATRVELKADDIEEYNEVRNRRTTCFGEIGSKNFREEIGCTQSFDILMSRTNAINLIVMPQESFEPVFWSMQSIDSTTIESSIYQQRRCLRFSKSWKLKEWPKGPNEEILRPRFDFFRLPSSIAIKALFTGLILGRLGDRVEWRTALYGKLAVYNGFDEFQFFNTIGRKLSFFLG